MFLDFGYSDWKSSTCSKHDSTSKMGKLKVKVSNVTVEGIVGVHGVFSVTNGNEELVDLSAEKRME